MRWTRVVALADFEEGDVAVYKMPKDIQDALKQMEEIDLKPGQGSTFTSTP